MASVESDSLPLVEYDLRWASEFEEEKTTILKAIGGRIIAIEHYGSTAIPGIGAKPIIDILIAVRRLDDAKECIEPLLELGYQYRPLKAVPREQRVVGTRYFKKGRPGANTHHIRMVKANSGLWHRYLLFRDYLRNHPGEARRYYELKRELHAEFGKRLPLEAKRSYIESVIAKARAETEPFAKLTSVLPRNLSRNLRLTQAETRFIRSRDTCRLATVGRDRWPHCVPVGYLYEKGVFYIPSARAAKKISNLRANGRACIMIDDENSKERGIMIQGQASIVGDQRFPRLGTWMESKTGWTMGADTVMVVFKPVRKASWNLSKRSD